MAKAKQAASARRTRHGAQIRRLVVLDALRSWGVSAIADGLIFLVWLLGNVELLSMAPALTIAGGLLLLLALHAGLRDFLNEQTTIARASLIGGFAIAWAGATFFALHATVNPPPPLFAGDLKAQAPPVTVPLNGAGGSYRIVVEGHMLPGQDQTSHSGHYRLRVSEAGGADRIFDGDFTESWRRQRLGRRGSVPVRTAHTVAQHFIESDAGGPLTLELAEVSPGLRDTVTVQVYPRPLSTALLAALGAFLVAGALVIDTWRSADPGEALMTMGTFAAVLGIGAFRSLAPPRPSFADLVVNGTLGAIAGIPAAALLWRLTRRHLRKLVGSER